MLDRNFRRSLFDYGKSLLTAPPSGSFNLPFNVYIDLKSQFRNKSFVPTRPFVFMIDRNVEPTIARVPLIVVETSGLAKVGYELGNRNGHAWSADFNIFGNTRGMRDDLTSLFRDFFGLSFSIRDYTTAGSPVIDTALLLDEPSAVEISMGEDVAMEGSLYNFNVVSYNGVTNT